jgi:eukaryotic-like serine/threonine-protein kinase
MLTGGVPFKGDTAVTVALRHVNEVPAAPATVVAGIAPALNQGVMKALAKDPANRYANAGEFAHDLRAVRAGAPVMAAAFDPFEERTQLVRRPVPPPESPTSVMTRRVAAGRAAGPARGAAPPPKKRTPMWVYITITAVAVLVIAGGLAIALAAVGDGNGARVPDVVDLREAAAVSKLQDAGFTSMRHDTYSDTVVAGVVVRQAPTSGTELAKGEAVEIWVSRGSSAVELIDFTGKSPSYVESWLSQHGLQSVRKTAQNRTVPAGQVCRQDPQAGQSVKRGGTVTYWVSRGVPKAKVPYVIGLSSSDAATKIEDAGLVVGTTSQQYSDSVASGEVIGQSPDAGTTVDRGSTVDITVSMGSSPSPSPSPSPSVIAVPGVISMNQDQAQTRLENEGFVVVVLPASDSGQAAGTVVDQDPSPDTQAAPGSTVTIYVQQ